METRILRSRDTEKTVSVLGKVNFLKVNVQVKSNERSSLSVVPAKNEHT